MSWVFLRVLLVVTAAVSTAGCAAASSSSSAGTVLTTTSSVDPTASPDTTAGAPTTEPTAGMAGAAETTATTKPAAPNATAKPVASTDTTSTTGPASPSSDDPTSVLVGLKVAPEGARAGYQRELFKHWVDADRDGCDTREEVLRDESRTAAQVDPYGCKVLEGDWFSSYDGLTFTDPSELDIDHMVPLAEAWDSGASNWDAGRRQSFANDLGHSEALRAVSASSNRSKGDLDPGQWKPTRDAAWCEYANEWVTVKKAWDLTADQNEVDDLRLMLRTCGGSPQSGGPSTTSTTTAAPTPTPTSTSTSTAPSAAGGTVTIAALDCQGEAVQVRNGGSSPADLTGWSIHDEGTKHTYRFPAGYTLAPGAAVTVRSGGPAGAGELAWTGSSVWNNDGDTASLVNAGAGVVSTRSCS